MMRKKVSLFLLTSLWIGLSACNDGELFLELGSQFPAPIAVAVDTTTMRAYVVNSNNNIEFTSTTFAVLDITNPAAPVVLSQAPNPVPIPNFSGQIHYDPTTRTIFTPNRASDNPDDTIDSLLRINVDEASGSFETVDSFVSGENPFGVSCCDAQGRLYLICSGDTNGSDEGSVLAYNPNDLSSFIQISLDINTSDGNSRKGLESTEGVMLGNRLFVTNRFGDIYVINTDEVGDPTKNPIDHIVIGEDELDGEFLGIATDGSLLYVVDADDDADLDTPTVRVLDPSAIPLVTEDVSVITEINLATTLLTSIPVGEDPNEITIFKGRGYVTNRDDDTVTVFDLASNSVITTIPVGDEPFGMAAFTVGTSDFLYVTNLRGNSISIIDLASNTVVNTFQP